MKISAVVLKNLLVRMVITFTEASVWRRIAVDSCLTWPGRDCT